MNNSAEKYTRLRTSLLSRLAVHVLFFLLVLFGNVSREWLHSFTGHTDTVHHVHDTAQFEPEHHHCSFLEIPAPAFLYEMPALWQFRPSVAYAPCAEYTVPHYLSQEARHTALRGPPLV
jgi:hypothetical protein